MSRVAACILLVVMLVPAAAYADQDQALKGPYMGQKPPGMTPEVFAPGFVSSGEHEFAPSFSPDGNEFYFSRGVGQYRKKSVMVSRLAGGTWSEPVRALSYGDENFEARVHPGGEKIFFMGGYLPWESSSQAFH